MVVDQFVYMKISVSNGYMNKNTGEMGAPRVSVKEMQPLQDILEKMAKKITLNVEINSLDSAFLKEIEGLIKQNQGTNSLYIHLLDAKKSLSLSMYSKKKKVAITNELIKEIERKRLIYKIN